MKLSGLWHLRIICTVAHAAFPLAVNRGCASWIERRSRCFKNCQSITLKANSHCFRLRLSDSVSFNLSNVGEIFCGWTQQTVSKFRNKRNFLCCVHVFYQNGRVKLTEKCTKSVSHLQSCCFANLNLLLFCRSYCRRRLHCLSLLLLWSRNVST